MIVYALRCDSGHGFDAWFKDAAAYDALAAAGEVTCPECGSTTVAKAPMAPAIGGRATRRGEAARAEADDGAASDAADAAVATRPGVPADPRQAAMAAVRQKLIALRRQVEATHEDVGDRFAAEARAIDAGDAEDRPIRGQATADEAREMIEDGLPVLPLPVVRSDS